MDRPDLDDDTYMAIQRLNSPEAVADVEDGTNSCPCPRCNRLRQIMAGTAPTIDATDSSPAGVDAIKRMFEGLGFDVEVVQPGEPIPRGWNDSFGRSPAMTALPEIFDGADNLKSEGLRAAEEAGRRGTAFLDAIFSAGRDVDQVNMEKAMLLGDDLSAARKGTPIASGVLSYFPSALLEVAKVSKIGNEKHNPGEPLHWAREKSTDETDALVRHLLDYLMGDDFDLEDGVPHLAKVAWRSLALLERWCDGEDPGR